MLPPRADCLVVYRVSNACRLVVYRAQAVWCFFSRVQAVWFSVLPPFVGCLVVFRVQAVW